jgi:hypothetical protein
VYKLLLANLLYSLCGAGGEQLPSSASSERMLASLAPRQGSHGA